MIMFNDICKKIEKDIGYGLYGESLPSINDLSVKFDAGPSTVKRAIRQLKELNIVEGIQGKCIRINPKAKGNIFFHKNVVIFIHLYTLANPFYSKIVDDLKVHLEKVCSCVHIFNSINQLRECGFVPDVMIISEIFNSSERTEVEKYCPAANAIMLNGIDPRLCCIASDNAQAGYHAMNYLYGKNHRHIGIITTQAEYSYSCSRLRYDGALKFAGEHSDLCLYNENAEAKDKGEESCRILLTKHPGITAIFATMDYLALGVYAECKKRNMAIPDDLSVLGFDDQLFSHILFPGLSTFRENHNIISDLLFNQLKRRIKGDKTADLNLVDPVLIERDSVKQLNERI